MRAVAAVAGAALALVSSASAAAAPAIHAHRGGPVLAGVPTYPEESIPAFRNAIREGYWLELDAKLTRDGQVVVFHDSYLERMTPCVGEIAGVDYADLDECRLDMLGSPGGGLPAEETTPREPIPKLADVLALARDEGAFVNLEIKNQPGDPDFDNTPAYANAVMDVVVASRLPAKRLIVQSFWPPNLSVAQQRLPGVETSLLTLESTNEGGPAAAATAGNEWVSPGWPIDSGYVSSARGFGRKVVPYTLNLAADITAANALGVDAVITDDPLMAQRTLGLTRAQLLPDDLRPTVSLEPRPYASAHSRDARFPVTWTGEDRGSGIENYTLEVRRNTNASPRWRLVSDSPRPSAQLRGRRGATYQLRVRARDRMGNRSRFDYAEITVPFDDRVRTFVRAGGWKRARSKRAWRGTVTRGRRGASGTFRFEGQRVAIIARRTRRAGRLHVSLDGRRGRVIRLRGRSRHRQLVYRSKLLRPGRHRLTVEVRGGGPVDLDAFGVDTGPPPPR